MCLGVGEHHSSSPFQSTVVTPSCYCFENMTQLSTCQKARQINPDVASWPVMFLGPLTLLYIYTAQCPFKHILKTYLFQLQYNSQNWFVKAVLVRTLYFTLFIYLFDSSSPVQKLLSGKAGWKPRWRARTHWRDNVSWLAWERSLKVTTMSNLPHSWFGHSLCTHANWSLSLCSDCLIFTECNVCVSFSEKSEKVWSSTICLLKHIIPAVFLAVFSDSGGTKERFAAFVRVHFGLLWSINTAQSSTTGQFVHPKALLMSRCWQSAVRNSLNPSWNPSFVNGTYLYETVSLRSVTEGPLIIRTQDVLCRGRGAGGATLRPHTRWNMLSNSMFDNGRQRNWSEWVWCFFFFSLVYLPLKTWIDKSHV